MKKLSIFGLLLIACAMHATPTLEKAIYASDYSQVQKELALIEPLAEQEKAILYELANDVLEKRNAKLLINTDVHEAANDFKRFTRSGMIAFLGLVLISGSVASGGLLAGIDAHPTVPATVIFGGFGLGALVALKGLRDFCKSLSLDVTEKKSHLKKLLKKYTNAIMVKQEILKA